MWTSVFIPAMDGAGWRWWWVCYLNSAPVSHTTQQNLWKFWHICNQSEIGRHHIQTGKEKEECIWRQWLHWAIKLIWSFQPPSRWMRRVSGATQLWQVVSIIKVAKGIRSRVTVQSEVQICQLSGELDPCAPAIVSLHVSVLDSLWGMKNVQGLSWKSLQIQSDLSCQIGFKISGHFQPIWVRKSGEEIMTNIITMKFNNYAQGGTEIKTTKCKHRIQIQKTKGHRIEVLLLGSTFF